MRDDVEADPKVVVGKADMTWEYKAGARTGTIDVYVDSDWAGSSARAHPEAW